MECEDNISGSKHVIRMKCFGDGLLHLECGWTWKCENKIYFYFHEWKSMNMFVITFIRISKKSTPIA